MSLFLDSANVNDVREAFASGLVVGVTTNPGLLARGNKRAEEILLEVSQISDGIVFYQLTGNSIPDREIEARRIVEITPGKIGLKIPCTWENLTLAAKLSEEGFIIGITAIFSAAQAYLAIQSGADYILPYVNRSTRLQEDGLGLVKRIRSVIDVARADIEIIAASIKTPAEAVDVHLAGAHHLTLPWEVIKQMGDHRLSYLAIEEFNQYVLDD